MTLKNILVDKAERTNDILSQVDEDQRQEFEEKFDRTVYGLINANNRGYCKVLLREEEIEFFGNLIENKHDSLDSVNRWYIWRILWSHVRSGDLKIKHFMALAGENIGRESIEDIVRFLLQKIQYCLNMGLIYADQMKSQMDPSTKKDKSIIQFREQVLKPKLFMEVTSDSLKTQLATFMINFTYPREQDNWKEMFASGEITNDQGQTYTLNKLQRYYCVMKLASWGHDHEALFD